MIITVIMFFGAGLENWVQIVADVVIMVIMVKQLEYQFIHWFYPHQLWDSSQSTKLLLQKKKKKTYILSLQATYKEMCCFHPAQKISVLHPFIPLANRQTERATFMARDLPSPIDPFALELSPEVALSWTNKLDRWERGGRLLEMTGREGVRWRKRKKKEKVQMKYGYACVCLWVCLLLYGCVHVWKKNLNSFIWSTQNK